MLRVLEIAVIIAIIVYGIIKLIQLFSGWKLNKREEKLKEARNLSDLKEQAERVAKEKEDILGETQKNKEVIDNINNTLNN
jgi:prepilin signal peptidase PulO-like enzyme (type II secretory pathway)